MSTSEEKSNPIFGAIEQLLKLLNGGGNFAELRKEKKKLRWERKKLRKAEKTYDKLEEMFLDDDKISDEEREALDKMRRSIIRRTIELYQ